MICGTSPNGNAHTVYCMIHHPELVPPVEGAHIELGHLAEPVIIARHNTKHADAGKFLPGKTYERVIDGIPCRATPDGELEDGSAILECKVRFFRDRDFYGEEGSSNVMASDYDQVQWQMHVMGEHVKRAYVAVWFGIAQDLVQFIVERDQERIDEMMAIVGTFLDLQRGGQGTTCRRRVRGVPQVAGSLRERVREAPRVHAGGVARHCSMG